MMKAPVNRIIPFSNVDGPGNRFAIFFQGCPFSCLFCHNPETINECIHCGECVAGCPSGALTIVNQKVVYNYDLCIDCDQCIQVCRYNASPKIRYMSVDDIIAELLPAKDYLRGITVSGGEAMCHASFLTELFKEVKKLNLTCLIDSNGYFDFSQYPELLSYCDGVMLDVKGIDENFHLKVTGQSNKSVLANLNYLLSVDKLFEVRTVIFPNYLEENEKTVRAVSELIKDKCQYKLLKYRKFGVREEGIAFFGDTSPSDEEMHRLKDIAESLGVKNTIII